MDKYRKGDVVYLKKYHSYIDEHEIGINNRMMKYFGTQVTINGVNRHKYGTTTYFIIEDKGEFEWDECWFEEDSKFNWEDI